MSNQCYIIAEAGLCHNGDITLARNLIQAASNAGADAVKFQKRNVDTLAISSILDAKDDRFPNLGSTYRQIREALEFSFSEYVELKLYTEEHKMDFLCTPFDIESVMFLERLKVQEYKIASHSNTNLPLIQFMAELGKPVYMSTGACTEHELDRAVECFTRKNVPLTILHCVSAYPTPTDQHNLSMISTIRNRYNLPVGYSGHELGYLPTLAAVSLGASVVERHFTMDSKLMGFDHAISLEPEQLTNMISDVKATLETLGKPQKSVSELEMVTRNKYKVSMVSNRLIHKGSMVTDQMVTYRNPGTGIHPDKADQILGKYTTVEIPPDTLFELSMVNS